MSEQSERMKVDSDAVLACPFCGPVEIVHRWAGNITIKHKDACFLHATTTLHGAAHIAAWNRRASRIGEWREAHHDAGCSEAGA